MLPQCNQGVNRILASKSRGGIRHGCFGAGAGVSEVPDDFGAAALEPFASMDALEFLRA